VLLNLLINAIAASRDGDRITIGARAENRDGTRAVVVSVRDRGTGIDTDVLPRVFDPFYTTKEDGTGLGLSISHTIVRDHGGTIDIESAPGAGTTVTVVLPAENT